MCPLQPWQAGFYLRLFWVLHCMWLNFTPLPSTWLKFSFIFFDTVCSANHGYTFLPSSIKELRFFFTGALLHKSCVLISQSLLLQYNWHMSRGGIFSHQQMGFKSYLYDLRPNQDLEVKSYLLVTKYSSSEITFYNYNYIICIKCPSYSSIVLVLHINYCF